MCVFLNDKKDYANVFGAFYQTKSGKPIPIFGVVNITQDKQLTVSVSEVDMKEAEKDKEIGDDITKLKKYASGFPIYSKGFFKYDKDAPTKQKPENKNETK